MLLFAVLGLLIWFAVSLVVGPLLGVVLRRCDVEGCYKIQLLSRSHRHDAHAFYAGLGFERVAEGFRRYRS